MQRTAFSPSIWWSFHWFGRRAELSGQTVFFVAFASETAHFDATNVLTS